MAVTSLAIPRASLAFWIGWLIRHGVPYEGPTQRFGRQALALRDPDGLALELVAAPDAQERAVWEAGPVPAEHAIRGLHGVALWEDDTGRTAEFLTGVLGFQHITEQDSQVRYGAGDGGPGTLADVRSAAGFWQGVVSVGSVHHVAWRVSDDEQLLAWREKLAELGLAVTPVRDRQYFHSIYFHEPGGVLFEIATAGPGFGVDEPLERLGTQLMLPPWLEPQRAQIEAGLPSVHLPGAHE